MRLIAILLLMTLQMGAQAQEYPTRQVHFIVPAPPGSAPDALARLLAQRLAPHFNRPFVVENRTGAANLIGSEYVARSSPDGYTILVGTSQVFGILPGLHPKMPFDAIKDFSPIVRMAHAPHVLVVPVSVPVSNVVELVNYIRSKPGQLNYGSAGIGSSHHLIMEAFLARANGIKVLHVPFKGGPAILTAMLGGQVQIAMTGLTSVIPPARAGAVRILGLSTKRRSSVMSDIVPIAEQGYPGFDLTNAVGLLGPAGTPASIVSALATAATKAFSDPEMTGAIEKIGFEVSLMGPDEYAKSIRSDIGTYAVVIKSASIKME